METEERVRSSLIELYHLYTSDAAAWFSQQSQKGVEQPGTSSIERLD